ncbi:maltose/glucose-specific PTS transporter subunit IIBC [Eremococcus coleocola]|uniref:PTS system maltose and glucose-specific IIBC component n=1 Tax=Eremococcus coleocola ACS-139-V-Col8 TaxID=908337 RepID=E4KRI6_9LACT|nr:maltose/glucose-specific PTS transporter subunit IIBC [Eremococcus coleocola]EFR30432.1 PTS system maltose and glucose-specific IIBC component [Eremococcus coleocola ACS-139-V-Col8]
MEKRNRPSFMEFLQGLGRTFMLPVALLSFMGLLLGIGSAFSSTSTIEAMPFLDNEILQIILRFLSTVGGFAFSYLPVMFAMAIPLGLARREKGVAAFSGFVGYTVMILAINFYLTEAGSLAEASVLREAGQGMVFGIQTLELGVLGGIIVGVLVYYLHERFYDIQLPDSFAFFSGVRFVPIITSLVLSVVGLILPIIWPFFAFIIQGIGNLIQRAGVFGPFLFGAGERLLLPFGLHHILVAMIRFTDAGGTEVVNGETVSGALNIFFAQLNSGEAISGAATAFLSQGKMPTFIFGLPGAALAMYQVARPENRARIKGLLISGVVATAVTGITEPIEFLFLFISPLLWIFHVIMTGAGFLVMSLLGVLIGNTDGGILDFLIFGIMQGSYTRWWLVLIVGAIWFAIYYSVFKFVILKQDLPTPGRAVQQDDTEYSKEELNYSKDTGFDVKGILEALGGAGNIASLDNCVTRLRLVLEDGTIVDDDRLKDLGALGVIHLDKQNVQVVIGTKVTSVRNELESYL